MSTQAPILLWLRRDLRLADNPALHAAAADGRPLVLAFILDDHTPGRWRDGGAARWWLHMSLAAFAAALAKRGGALLLRRGRAETEMARLVDELKPAAVFWNRAYEPHATARDGAVKQALAARGVEARSFPGNLLFEPWTVETRGGGPFKVFTPFWRACLARGGWRAPLPAPKQLRFHAHALAGDALDAWRLTPRKPDWAAGLREAWTPGEAGARAALAAFTEAKLTSYAQARDHMGQAGASRLSPHLHWGEISPAQVFAALPADAPGADKFRAELGWREFAHHLLFHWPDLPERNWRRAFDAVPWREDEAAFAAWARGCTGYPVVDAGMRELWTTGWMHNRARMLAASFLVKHLLIDWRRGADWFWDTLVDADLANNAAGWQWVAGSGADAAPYFRIFNPVTQGERYDAGGAYVRRWLPELAALPDAVIHKPWTAPPDVLAAAGVRLGQTYPAPIVEHGAARARALDAFAAVKSG